MNQSDAYREAYDCSKMKDATIWNKASALSKDDEVRARIDELKCKVEEKLVYTALESFKKLELAQELALSRKNVLTKEDNPDITNFIKAEELKGKMVKLYKDQLEIETLDKTPFEIVIVK